MKERNPSTNIIFNGESLVWNQEKRHNIYTIIIQHPS